MTLQREMGLKLLAETTLASLGIRDRKVALRAGRMRPTFLEFSTSKQTSSLIVTQQCWKKSIVNPSGPGALIDGILFTASSTSRGLIGRIKLVFWS